MRTPEFHDLKPSAAGQIVLYRNSHIMTMNPDQPVVDCLAIRDGVILESGFYPTLKNQFPIETPVVMLQGKCVLPGLNDAHVHTWKVGHLRTTLLDVRGVFSLDELLDKLSHVASTLPPGCWLQARGYNETNFPKAVHPTYEDLDRAVPDRPVWLIRTCAHIAVANTKALERARISKHTKPPPGGAIGVLASGELSGVFHETALGLVQEAIPAPTVHDYVEMIRSGQQAQLACGITSATDPAVTPQLIDAYRYLDARGELLNRHNLLAIRRPDGGTAEFPLPEVYDSPMLRINGVKAFADGGLSGATAALKVEYRHAKTQGILRFETEELFRLLLPAHRAGLRIGVHAIGDEAIDQLLTVYEKLYADSPGLQHRVEHFGLPSESMLARASALQLHAIPQATFVRELGVNFRAYLPDDYWNRPYPLGSMLKAGINVALSSDAPVVRDFHPLGAIQTAVTRQDSTGKAVAPSESISLQQALHAYTVAGAYASGDEACRGMMRAGMVADFIVVDSLVNDASIPQLHSARVQQTYLAGNCVFDSTSQTTFTR